MMRLSSKENLEVGGVAAFAPDHLLFRCFYSFDGLTSMDTTLIVEFSNGQFRINRQIEEECTTIKVLRDKKLWCLGSFGNLYVLSRDKWNDLTIEGEPYRYLNNMWEAKEHLYAIGRGTTILRLTDNRWMKLPSDQLDEIDLFSMACSSEGTLYVVGEKGSILQLSNGELIQIETPTNYDLYGIHVENDSRMIICGENGSFFIKDMGKWRDYSRTELGVNFYDLAYWNKQLFISGETDILTFGEGEVKSIARIEAFSIHIAGQRLWAIAPKSIHCYDGHDWREFVLELEVESPKTLEPKPRD